MRGRFQLMGNFLATDDVPGSLFGFKIVADEKDYTPADLVFFKEHPEAGGYYDLGEDGSDGPEDGLAGQAAEKGGDAAEFASRNPSLIAHVKSFEKLRLDPYEDVGGHAIGYGAHTAADGSRVTAKTARIDEATADRMLARDLRARREVLSKTLPNWPSIPGEAKQALLDVAMGRDDVLSAKRSPGLHRDLAAAGSDPAKLREAVKRHYTTYRKSARPEDQAGLEARRVAGMKMFFGEDFAYEKGDQT